MKYRLTIIAALEKTHEDPIQFEYCSKVDMDLANVACAMLLIHLQDDLKVMQDYSNDFIKEQFVDGEWEEIEEEDEYFGL